jgi:hypothetical protein
LQEIVKHIKGHCPQLNTLGSALSLAKAILLLDDNTGFKQFRYEFFLGLTKNSSANRANSGQAGPPSGVEYTHSLFNFLK